jgi:hypothetical protein
MFNIIHQDKDPSGDPSLETITRGVLSIRPYLASMDRIRNISEHPWMARQIKEIVVYAGDIQLEEFFSYATKFAEDFHPQAKKPFLPRKVLRMMRANRYCHYDELSEPFSKLPHVECLRVLSKEFPFAKHDLLEKAWLSFQARQGPTWDLGYQDLNIAAQVYLDVLRAARSLPIPVKSVVLDLMPLELFTLTGINNLRQNQAAVREHLSGVF